MNGAPRCGEWATRRPLMPQVRGHEWAPKMVGYPPVLNLVMANISELTTHPFVKDVFTRAVAIRQLLGDRHPARVVPEFTREPDEHEFFLLGAGFSIAETLNCCYQLEQIPVLLANHRQTAAMEKAGINRHTQIVYHVENYLIRTQALLDRVWKLVDAVFHLTNDPKNCRYDVIIRNVKVKVSTLPPTLKTFKKTLDRYAAVRNEIVHHHSFTNDALRRLDMYFLLDRWNRLEPANTQPNVSELIKDHIHEVLWFKKKEFVEFNAQIATSVADIFDKLSPYFLREEVALRSRLGK